MTLLEDLRYIFVGDALSFVTTLCLGVEVCFMVWGKHYARAWREVRGQLLAWRARRR